MTVGLEFRGAFSRCGVTTNDTNLTVTVTLNGSGSTAPVAGDVIKLFDGTALLTSYTLLGSDITAGFVNLQTRTVAQTCQTQSASDIDSARQLDAASNSL